MSPSNAVEPQAMPGEVTGGDPAAGLRPGVLLAPVAIAVCVAALAGTGQEGREPR